MEIFSGAAWAHLPFPALSLFGLGSATKELPASDPPCPLGRGFCPPAAETKALHPFQHEPEVKRVPSQASLEKKTNPCCEGEGRGGQVLVSGTWSPA